MFINEKLQPALTQAQYDAIMGLQPKDRRDCRELVSANAFSDNPDQLLLKSSVSFQGRFIKNITEADIPAPDSYSLSEIQAYDLAGFNKAVALLRLMVMSPLNGLSAEERASILADFYNLQADNKFFLKFYLAFYTPRAEQSLHTLPMFRIS